MIVGVAWYRPEQDDLLRALSEDTESMAKTYDEWLAGAAKMLEDLRERGLVGRKVDVDINELASWCQQRNMPLNGEARSTYAAEHARPIGEGGQR